VCYNQINATMNLMVACVPVVHQIESQNEGALVKPWLKRMWSRFECRCCTAQQLHLLVLLRVVCACRFVWLWVAKGSQPGAAPATYAYIYIINQSTVVRWRFMTSAPHACVFVTACVAYIVQRPHPHQYRRLAYSYLPRMRALRWFDCSRQASSTVRLGCTAVLHALMSPGHSSSCCCSACTGAVFPPAWLWGRVRTLAYLWLLCYVY
jgi:hypothetical protein